MYVLMVSHDCGMNYRPEMKSEKIEDFEQKCKELNENWLRWVIEDEKGNMDMNHTCSIHNDILDTIQSVNGGGVEDSSS